MLDIEIFSVDEPLYYKGEKIGTMPHIFLGNYTELTKADKEVINSFYYELTPAHRSIFSMMIHTLGQTFFARNLAHAIDRSHHPLARQQMLHVLHDVYPMPFHSQKTLLAQQQQILDTLHKNGVDGYQEYVYNISW